MTFTRLMILVILITSCAERSDKEKRTSEKSKFTFEIPGDWQIYKGKGIDSDIGIITNGKDTIEYDYGWYSQEINSNDTVNNNIRSVTIGEMNGVVSVTKDKLPLDISLFVRVNAKDRLRMSGKGIIDTAALMRVFHSIRFLEPDFSVNKKWQSSNFGLRSGKILFFNNCASCHGIDKNAVGPSMASRLQIRDVDWVHRFLTNRKTIPIDSERVFMEKSYTNRCGIFTGLTKYDVHQIFEYCGLE